MRYWFPRFDMTEMADEREKDAEEDIEEEIEKVAKE